MAEDHGTIHWTELMTRDVDAALQYYAGVCGWTYETMPMSDGSGDYHVAMAGERMVAGITDIGALPGFEDASSHWYTYIAVDDVDAAVEASRRAGATIQRAPWDVPEVGRVAMVIDPSGAPIGLMTPSGL